MPSSNAFPILTDLGLSKKEKAIQTATISHLGCVFVHIMFPMEISTTIFSFFKVIIKDTDSFKRLWHCHTLRYNHKY